MTCRPRAATKRLHAGKPASRLLELAGMLVCFNHIANVIDAKYSIWGRALHVIQASIMLFCVDKVEDSALKFITSDCEHFSGAGRRFIEAGRFEEVDTAPG